MEASLMNVSVKSDFEKNLFLRSEVKELKKIISEYKSGSILKEKDLEIGMLKSERDELRDKVFELKNAKASSIYGKLSKNQKAQIKASLTDTLFVQQREQLAIQNKKIVELNEQLKSVRANLFHEINTKGKTKNSSYIKQKKK